MHRLHRLIRLMLFNTKLHLKQTAWIARQHIACLCVVRMLHFVLKDRACHLRLYNIVYAGRAAAAISFDHFNIFSVNDLLH
ncbi:hypothetical protein D3C77_722660 [compost metagenome]